MYNTFVFHRKKTNVQNQELTNKKRQQWLKSYHQKIQPQLIQNYCHRVQNFISRLQDDKHQLYQYRQQSERKAHQLLKEIYRKQSFLGDPNIRLRNNQDWNSLLSASERIEKEKNKAAFQKRYGDSNIAYRSIASQSVYHDKQVEYRSRSKNKQIQSAAMKFGQRSLYVVQQSKKHNQSKKRCNSVLQSTMAEQNEGLIRRRSSSNSNAMLEDDNKSQALTQTVLSGSAIEQAKNSILENEVERSKEMRRQANQGFGKTKKSSKVYFKKIVDIEQNTTQLATKRSLQQILTRFGLTRIKDLKKQAMIETDNFDLADI